ncbi:MAG: TonB-dependent receptor domain-containing protein, partial [Gemmatimonadales bacterium]
QEDLNAPSFFRLTRVPAIANVLQRDTLGRLYIRPNLQTGGQQNENPLQNAEQLSDVGTTDRFIGGATVRFTPVSAVDVEANFSYDYRGFAEEFFRDKGFRNTGATFAALGLGRVFQSYDNTRSLNSSLNATYRRQLGDLATRWNLRYLFEQQDATGRDGAGNSLAAVGVPDLDNATASITVGSSATATRQIGLFAGTDLVYKDRYIFGAVVRRDGTSLFGANNRWATFGRVSLAWRPSQEPWWFVPAVNEFKLRASRGSAGRTPRFEAQYETFTVSATSISFGTLGNSDLRPEITTETEVGTDIEILNRIGLSVTYAQSETRDQILLVPAPAATGFQDQWQNAGTLENKTWELSLNVPVITRRDLSWSWRFIYDRNRTVITALNVPPFRTGAGAGNTGNMFRVAEGERYGTIYGRNFLTSCDQLPQSFQSQCGPTGAFQVNDDGMLVWVGAGNSWRDGITKNLWGTSLPDAQAPWGVGVNWGMLIIERNPECAAAPDANCAGRQVPLGNGLPDWRFGISQTFQYRRLSVYGMLEGVMGRDVWNQGRHWAHLDYLARRIDQDGATVETAKPIGYYWRGKLPDGGAGLGGFYDILAPNSFFVEDASYAKLRELAVTYRVGPVASLGDWTVTLVGRNLFTITGYTGFDPEVGSGGGIASSAAINAVDAFGFPNTRSVTFGVSTSF